LSGYCVESRVIEDPGEIEQEWLDLQNRADCSWFQSWGWIGTWLEQIAKGLQPLVVKVWFEGTLVGMGVFVSGRVTRHQIICSDALFLNEYPFEDRNMIIEYNGLLAEPPHQSAVYRKTITHLLQTHSHCDEIFFGAVNNREVLQLPHALSEDHDKGVELKTLEESSTWSVDLDNFGHGIDAYLATLSKNRRSQIRRAFRAYEEQGPLQLDEASNPEETIVFFDGLKALHTARWEARGRQGSFSNPLWESFHRALIRLRFVKGEIQLIRVSNPSRTIGYLYSFIWRNRVYVLQTGFEVVEDKRLMPGYIVHSLAIAYNKQKGMKVYDLLHGDSLYKRILCNHNETLYWLVLQRKQLKFGLEDCAVKVARWFRRRGV